MKLFVPPPRANRAPKSLATGSADSLGHGMDVALSIAVFLVAGLLIDRWLGTAPVFTIVLLVVAAVGQFVRLKYTYDAQMEQLEAERRAARSTRIPGPAPHLEARADDADHDDMGHVA